MTWNMDDPRWTAYVLGELADADRAELDGVLAGDAEARDYVASLRETIGALESELRDQPAPAVLDELQRRRIQAAARPSRRKRWFAAGVAASAVAAGVGFVMLTTVRETSRADYQSPLRLRVESTDDLRSQLAVHQDVRGFGLRPRRIHEQRLEHTTEAYSRIDDNPFFETQHDPLSTFSVDVDSAAYSNLRRFLAEGHRPPRDAVRIEEMINYFTYDYPRPKGNDPFSITTEVGPAPWAPTHQLVRIGLQTEQIDSAQVPPRNLTFLIDTSGSMDDPHKLPLLVQALNMLVDNLRPQDSVAIVVYAGAAGLVLDPTNDKDAIRAALGRLAAGGSTNGGAGIELAYDVAARHLKAGGINRVILCSDGDMNVGITSEGDLTRLIEKERDRGVFLTVLGFGMGNLKDATMEKLADRGNGNYAYIDSLFEARKVLVKEAGSTLVTVAKDVKLQVEFNPATVAGYRLIGYENRVMAHQDFNDDKKDAGDIGAGHAVTALYELVPAGVEVPGPKVDDLKYQAPAAPAGSATDLFTVKVRYKTPSASTSSLVSRAVPVAAMKHELAATTDDFRWAAAIAGFGMLLRDSPYRGNLAWPTVLTLADGARGQDVEGYRKQAVQLIAQAAKLPPATP